MWSLIRRRHFRWRMFFSRAKRDGAATHWASEHRGLVGENVTWQANQSSGSSVIGDPSFGLGNNGGWDSGRVGYTALNLETGFMDYLFAKPVNAVGGFMSYGYSAGNPE